MERASKLCGGVFAVLSALAATHSFAHSIAVSSLEFSGGCREVNNGRLNIKVNVSSDGTVEGEQGTGLVTGFRDGDRLVFDLKVVAADVDRLAVTFNLDAFNRFNRYQLVRLAAWDGTGVGGRTNASWQHSLQITPDTINAEMFASTSALGRGLYSVTVHCEPVPMS